MLQQRSEEAQTQNSETLTSDELSEVLNAAIAREQSSDGADVTTLEDALEIARQANIPEEHVRAALEEVRTRRRREEDSVLGIARQAERRLIVKAKRRRDFLMGTFFAGAAAAVGALIGAPVWILGGLAAFSVMLGARWLLLPVGDPDAMALEVITPPGTCRVCGREAHTPRSIFCEEHRFKPGSGT